MLVLSHRVEEASVSHKPSPRSSERSMGFSLSFGLVLFSHVCIWSHAPPVTASIPPSTLSIWAAWGSGYSQLPRSQHQPPSMGQNHPAVTSLRCGETPPHTGLGSFLFMVYSALLSRLLVTHRIWWFWFWLLVSVLNSLLPLRLCSNSLCLRAIWGPPWLSMCTHKWPLSSFWMVLQNPWAKPEYFYLIQGVNSSSESPPPLEQLDARILGEYAQEILDMCEFGAGTQFRCSLRFVSKSRALGFPGGAVVKNPPANAGDTGLSPGPGRSHMPWSN